MRLPNERLRSLVTALLLLALLQQNTMIILGKEEVKNLSDLLLSQKDFDKVQNIHRNWYFFSIKALLAQMAKELLATASCECVAKLKSCLKRIRSSKDVTKAAQCLTSARESERNPSLSSAAFLVKKKKWRRLWLSCAKRLDFRRLSSDHRRAIQEQIKDDRRIKRSPHRLVVSAVLKSDDEFFKVNQQRTVPSLLEPSSHSATHRLAKLFVSLFSKTPLSDVTTRWSVTYKKMVELKEKLEENENLPGREVYDRRIYDMVINDGSEHSHEKSEPFIPPFLKNIVGVVKSFSGVGNARILSPRLAPLMPDKAATRGFLSPALFPFYKDDAEEQILPIPKMLEDSGLNEKDRERVLEMVMEVSGARGTVENAMKVLEHLSSFGLGNEVMSVSEKVGESFERLRASFSRRQRDDLDTQGYTLMNVDQMRTLHQDQGLNVSEVAEQVEHYSRLSDFERKDALWETVAELAGRKQRRSRRQVSVLQPFVLSPYQFAPVFGLSILGPVVLSPNIFSPLILNPAVLSPWVMSPAIPLPFIVSPYVLSPYVLSPLVMAPFILNPYVLSPNVINPYVLSPLILSPLVLCPDVISPMTLGGSVLSPAVLSPSVLSKSYVMAAVLSPSVLS